MKQTILAIICLFLLNASANSEPITKQQALAQAQTFMKSKGRSLSSNTDIRRAPRKGAQNDNAYYYVFNADNNLGFVIVSGDDRTEPILGYSDTGSFDLDNLPENAQSFLAEITEQMEYMEAKGLSSQRRAPETAKRAIAPLLTTTWGQGNPYNINCPTDPRTGTVSYAGCVATAMAQVLYHHRAKAVTSTQAQIPSYSYSFSYNGTTYSKTVPAVASGAPIDWANMVDAYSRTTTTTAQKTAVANLMAYCGKSVSMNYKSTSSGANSYNVAYALRTYFGFDANTVYKRRGGYSVAEWDNMLYNELKAGRPIYYSGSSQGGGHAFVVDGVDDEGLYHVNWGWNGSSNGYFLISVLNPGDNTGIGASSTDDGYIMNGAAIFGAQPAVTPGEYSIYQEILSSQYISRSGLTIAYAFYNYTGKAAKFDCGIAIEDADGNLYVMDSISYTSNTSRGDYKKPDLTATISTFQDNNLPTGKYVVIPVSRLKGGNTWYRCELSSTSYVELNYTGSNLTATLRSANTLTATAWAFPGSLTVNSEQKVKVTVKGNNYTSSNVDLFLFAKESSATSYSSYVSQTVVFVDKGETTEVEFSFTPTSAGTWNLKVSPYTSTTSSGIGTKNVTITEGPETFTNGLSATYEIENSVATSSSNTYINVYENLVNGTITLKNDTTVDYVGQVLLSIWKNTTGTSYTLSTKSVRDVVVPAGGTATLDIKYPNLDYGVKYWVRCHYGSSTSKAVKGERVATIKHGIDKYQLVNGEVARSIEIPSSGQVTVNAQTLALDLTGTGTTKINGTPGQNFLLFLGASDAIPTGASGLNIVRNGTINELNLVDGAPFYAPEEFEANTVTYTRTPAIATDGTGGWETLIIPFAATKVMNLTDNQEIDWHHSASDTGKDFWLKRFTEIDGTDLTFENVDEMQPNEPYIIAVSDGSVASSKQNNGMMGPRKANSLQGKQIRFIGENAVIPESKYLNTRTSTYSIFGTFNTVTLSDIHTMNAAGTAFEKQASATVEPFRCYFKATNPSSAAAILPLDDVVDAITLPVSNMTEGQADIFTVSGMKIGTVKVVNGQADLTHLPKGIYIINGKKVVR
ncbi:MAG: C10 family peptidase [Prevotella sp.]|nr:C10 family peptidase [Prevotella sp.]